MKRPSRTDEAIAWINGASDGETRTQQQAATLFGIAQATIAGAIARNRAKCPACGQVVKNGRHVPSPGTDALRARLVEVVNTYAWHRGNCASNGGAPCDCGFADLEREVNGE